MNNGLQGLEVGDWSSDWSNSCESFGGICGVQVQLLIFLRVLYTVMMYLFDLFRFVMSLTLFHWLTILESTMSVLNAASNYFKLLLVSLENDEKYTF